MGYSQEPYLYKRLNMNSTTDKHRSQLTQFEDGQTRQITLELFTLSGTGLMYVLDSVHLTPTECATTSTMSIYGLWSLLQ